MRKIVKNVKGDNYSAVTKRFAVGFKIEGDPARYHFWVNAETFNIEPRTGSGIPTIYKNIDGVSPAVKTAYLQADSTTGRALVDQIDVKAAYAEAMEAYRVIKKKEDADRERQHAQALLEEAAPVLLSALVAILERSEGRLYDTDQKTGKTFDAIARDAVRKAIASKRRPV